MKSALLTIFFIAAAVLGVLVVRRRTSLERLQEHHEVAAAWFSVIGGVYGVVLAFVLVSSWQRFEEARSVVEAEANALLDVWRHGAALPSPDGEQMRALTLEYATLVLKEEWPAMAKGEEGPMSQATFDRVWKTLFAIPAESSRESVIFQNTLGKMDDLSDARRARLLFSRVSLPPILWAFLLSGGAVTIGFSYFFAFTRLGSQLLMTALLAGTIGAALGLIAELQTPFAGSVRVVPWALERLAALAKETPGVPPGK